MNVAEILKNAPKGTKLYSPVFGEVEFVGISGDGTLIDVEHNNFKALFYSDGRYARDGECMLFPSKDNRDWNNFYICPFKKGDFIVREYSDSQKFIAIFSHFGEPYKYTTNYLCLLEPDGTFKPKPDFGIGNVQEARLATCNEKKKLLDAIAKLGYYWDECSMTLNRPTLKFKVGDTICKRGGYLNHTIKSIIQDRYICEKGLFLRFVDQHEWEVAKFDINTLKPFDRVLVRDDNNSKWKPAFFYRYNEKQMRPYIVSIYDDFSQCIPYNNKTKHLLGTINDCDNFYKTW